MWVSIYFEVQETLVFWVSSLQHKSTCFEHLSWYSFSRKSFIKKKTKLKSKTKDSQN